MFHARIFTALLPLLVWLLVPLTMSHMGRVPHTHVLVGMVSDADMLAHLEAEADDHERDAGLHLRGGWILSVPFGDFGAFLAFVLVVALTDRIWIAPADLSHAVREQNFGQWFVPLPIPHPPPRVFGW